jgi:hypothetical protein
MEGQRVSANFGTEVDVGEGAISCYLDIVVTVGAERCNKVGRVVVKSIVVGDGEKEVFLDVFFLQASDLLTMFVDDGVLMWMMGDSSGARWSGEEVREELSFWGKRKWEVREDGSGWGRGGDNSDRGFSDRQWEVLDWDVSKWDALDDFFELKVNIGILVFGG